MNWAKAIIVAYLVVNIVLASYYAGARKPLYYTGAAVVLMLINYTLISIWVINA